MKSPQRIETMQRTLPFAFADNILSFYAEGAKAYWRAFGPLSQPAVQTIEAWEGWQRWYLEALEALFVRSTMAPIKEKRTPPQEPGRPLLLDPFSFLGFDD
jgi:hypothetical protein